MLFGIFSHKIVITEKCNFRTINFSFVINRGVKNFGKKLKTQRRGRERKKRRKRRRKRRRKTEGKGREKRREREGEMKGKGEG